MDAETLKVGELARRTGLSVRALHHYDAQGLLRPGRRTPAGHRLYSAGDVRRLQQIVSLRRLGLSLAEIRACLDDRDYSLGRVLRIHVERAREEIRKQKRLCGLLESLLDRLARDEEPSIEELTRTIEGTMSVESYYTPEQLVRLARRGEVLGEDRIREVQQEWAELFAAYERAMNAGADPAGEEVRALARKSEALVAEFTGGEADIEASLAHMYRSEGPGRVAPSRGMHLAPGVWEYMAEARRALRASRR